MASVIFRSDESKQIISQAYERFRAAGPPAEERTVPTRFGPTHLLVAGPDSAPPLVLLSGAMGSSAHAIREVVPLLSQFRVYVVDVIGQSVRSADVRLSLDGPDYGLWMQDVLDELGLVRAHVYGVSWGGFVAQKVATTIPERIDRLVLMVPAGIVKGPVWQGITEGALPITMFRLFGSEGGLRRFVRGQLTVPDDDWTDYFRDALRHYNLDIRIPPLSRPEQFANFDRPTLVFGASDDINFPGQALLERARRLIPHAAVELLEDCRHMPATDDPTRTKLCGRIAEFLRPGD